MHLNLTEYDIEGSVEPDLADADVLRELLSNKDSVYEAANIIESYGPHQVSVDIPLINAMRLRKSLPEIEVINERD